jgi:uncharacterized membrane protein YphA (DoxX/SURF4 family)
MREESTAPGERGVTLSGVRLTILVILRVAVGWHFLYEGLAKLYAPGWSSAGYLELSRSAFAPVFNWIAANPSVLRLVDLVNIWGLMAIGLALILGLFTRIACGSGIVLLFLYYLANPPFVGLDFGVPTEGHYLIVNKNVVEMAALIVLLAFPTGRFLGLDRLIQIARNRRSQTGAADKGSASQTGQAGESQPAVRGALDRRELLKALATLPVLGVFTVAVLRKLGWESYEEKRLAEEVDAITSATIKTFDFSSLKDLRGTLPHAYIKDLKLSRMILGGNLIGGWAHARDLIYVSKLIKAYHNKAKVFETFMLAERCGVNTILTNPILCGVINEYWRRKLGNIQFISDCGGNDLLAMVKKSIDNGACACYVQGATADGLVRAGKFDMIAKALDMIRQNGLPAGIGGHYLGTIKACVEQGLEPDFWMKTLHHTNYWSAKLEEEHDNTWCENPEETVAFMKDLEQPWIAFKVLAAGAIHPKEGFRYAFENGADFICVGMYDFQLVDDVNIALNVLAEDIQRDRPWRA